MLMQMYVIRDCLSEESSPPMLAKNDDVARVMFNRSFHKDDSRDGYQLLHVGMMDTEQTLFTITPSRVLELPIAVRDPRVPDLVDDLMGMKGEK